MRDCVCAARWGQQDQVHFLSLSVYCNQRALGLVYKPAIKKLPTDRGRYQNTGFCPPQEHRCNMLAFLHIQTHKDIQHTCKHKIVVFKNML